MTNSNEKNRGISILFTDKKTSHVAAAISDAYICNNFKPTTLPFKEFEKFARDNKVLDSACAIVIDNKPAMELILDHRITDFYCKYGVHIRFNASKTRCAIFTSSINDNERDKLYKLLKDKTPKKELAKNIGLYAGVAILGGLIGVGITYLVKLIGNNKFKKALQYEHIINIFQEKCIDSRYFPQINCDASIDELSDL